MDKVDETTREAIKSFWWRLEMLDRAGFLETSTRFLGYQVMSRMAREESLEILTCWEDMGYSFVTGPGGQLLSAAVPSDSYHFIGALQQLQRCLGVVSHVTRGGVDRLVKLGQTEDKLLHFTEELHTDGSLIRPDTILIFRLIPGAGLLVEESVKHYTDQCKYQVALPEWLTE